MDANATSADPNATSTEVATKYGTLAGGTRQKLKREIVRTTGAQKTTYYILLVLPFLMFFLTSYIVAFVYFTNPLKAKVVVALCAVVPIWFALRAQRKDGSSSDAHQNQLLVSTTGMAVLFGTAFGYMIVHTFFWGYFATLAAQVYTNVSPTQVAAGMADAGRISFSADASVDASRGIGYTANDGHEYCVAPVIASSETKEVQYWAIGEDCCGPSGRAGFACGDYKGEQGKQRNTIVELFPSPRYHDAVQLCQAENRYLPVDGALLVRFVADTDKRLQEIWSSGQALYWVVVLCAAGISVLNARALQHVL